MAPGITSKEFGGKLKVFDTGKKLYIITETPWYFWLTTVFFVLALVSIPYLLYLMYDYYEKIPEANKTHEDKKYFNGGIAMTVVLSIAIIAVIAGFIATEVRKNGSKLDRNQLEDYGKSLIVKGAAVRTSDLIKDRGEQYLNEARDTIAAKVINGSDPQSVNNWIVKNNEQKKAALKEAIEQYEKEKGIGQQTTNPPTQTTNPPTQTTNLPTQTTNLPIEPVVTDSNNSEGVNVTENLQESPISLSRSYKRRKSPSSLKKKKKKASPKKKKSTSSKRK